MIEVYRSRQAKSMKFSVESVRRLPLPGLLLFISVASTNAHSIEQTDPVEALTSELKKALAETSTTNTNLETNYVEALQNLQHITEQTGDLERSLKIRDEVRNYKMLGERNFSDLPQLEKLREVYEKSVEKIEADFQKSRFAVLKIYEERFRLLKKNLEEQENTELVLKADRRIKMIEEGIADPAKLVNLAALWILERRDDVESVREAKLERKDGKFIISAREKAGSYIKSTATFSVPFEMMTRVATDSFNIRYYLGDRVITILNWEVNPKQLRLHNPTPGIGPIGINDQGWVNKDELNDVQISFRKNRISVMVNGEMRGEMEGDFSALQGQVGIGPAFGSTLTLETFKVLPLQE
ncbi:MAG: hypothetical protein KA152_01230 [Verrucomicrobiales bacterium]|nr:hypothetical protein [Verrucomicrobiales bacterium]